MGWGRWQLEGNLPAAGLDAKAKVDATRTSSRPRRAVGSLCQSDCRASAHSEVTVTSPRGRVNKKASVRMAKIDVHKNVHKVGSFLPESRGVQKNAEIARPRKTPVFMRLSAVLPSSSVGRCPNLQAGGRRFESCTAHQVPLCPFRRHG
jgi:hypothetical protein